MDVDRRRAAGASKRSSVVAAGSVWETRMKSDQVKGGFKVFNADLQETTTTTTFNLEGNDGKRSTTIRGQGGAANLVAASTGKRKIWKSESIHGSVIQFAKEKKILDDQTKELSLRGSVSNNKGCERSPIRRTWTRTDPVVKVSVDQSSSGRGSSENDNISPAPQLRKANKVFDNSNEAAPEVAVSLVCQDKLIASDVITNVGSVIKTPPQVLAIANAAAAEEDDKIDDIDGEEVGNGGEFEVEKREINVQQEQKTEKIVVDEAKKLNQFKHKTSPLISSANKQQPPPVVRRDTIYSCFTKPTTISDEYQSFSETQSNSKLQDLVALVMWRDVSKSAFVFGIGTFITLSSSYTTDLNISSISVISYLGLVYLAAIFLCRAIICRGVIDIDDTSYVIGEEEAIWVLKLILPYLNELLLKLKALFSGDPATTMKLAVVLFVLARCGASITIWKMIKLGFFGVFIVPKFCSSYSPQLAGYGKFWIRRFGDAWESCSHKKAVAVAIFTLVWKLSSVVARIWAAFMLFAALRYYQQSMIIADGAEEEDDGDDDDREKKETRHHPHTESPIINSNREDQVLLPNRLRRIMPTTQS